MHRSSLSVVLLTIVTVVFAAAASAQITTATFYGVVQDPTGAVIPNAEAELLHEETENARTRQTSATGEFTFEFLPVGPYTLRIMSQGFKTHSETGIILGAAQRLRRTFTMEIGVTTEVVEVIGTAPLVNSVSAEQRESISDLEVSELPLGRRDISDIIALGTGIIQGERTNRRGKQFMMNGLGRSGANISMDGIDASASPELPQTNMDGGFNYIGVVSMEAVEEIQVSKGAFNAEYGRTLSGNINVITKSGTNNWHGSGFELFSSEELNARHSTLRSKEPFTYNQFGASIGGPIIRNKLFIFGTYEGYRERSFTPVNGDVPTQSLRSDLIAAVPEYQMILDILPLPNQPHDPDDFAARFIGPGQLYANTDHFVVRPDAWLTDNIRITGTYVADDPDRFIPRVSPQNSRLFRGNIDRYSIAVTAFGPQWSSESRYGWNRAHRERDDVLFQLKDPLQEEKTFGGRRIPSINIDEAGFGAGGGEYQPTGFAPNWSIDQKISYTKGKHSLKFGVQFFSNATGRANVENPQFTYGTVADALANTPTRVGFQFGVSPYEQRAESYGLFVQDDWRVTNKLVLNLGLRYDAYGGWVATGDTTDGPPHIFNAPLQFPDFLVGDRLPVDRPIEPDRNNFSPRFGFAYDLNAQGKTVIRGGVGISSTQVNPTVFSGTQINSATEPFESQFSANEVAELGITYPAYNEDVLPLVAGNAARASYRLVDANARAPYAVNYTFSIQRTLAPSLMLETAYVGNRGVKFLMDRHYNLPDRFTGIRPNPNSGGSLYFDNSESTHYHSWQTSLRKRYSANLLFNMHYTWGKIINYGTGDNGALAARAFVQEFFDVHSNRGPSFDDVNHFFVMDVIYDLPAFNGHNSFVRHALGGWQVAGIWRSRTGFPVTLDQRTSRARSRPDVIDPANAVIDDGGRQWLNPAAFARVPLVSKTNQPTRPGNSGRGSLPSPGSFVIDFAFGKSFAITEKVSFNLRADMLNALNHTNPSGLVTRINSGSFGILRNALPARQMQLHARISF